MRRMYSKNQLEEQIKSVVSESSEEVISALVGQDISVEGITSKGIANTGGLGNIGNVAISGDLSVSGQITGGEIIENMSGYSFTPNLVYGVTLNYVGVTKTGNKITFVIAGEILKNENTPYNATVGSFTIPSAIASKLVPLGETSNIDVQRIPFFSPSNPGGTPISVASRFYKESVDPNMLSLQFIGITAVTTDVTFNFRYEVTFLLSENLLSE